MESNHFLWIFSPTYAPAIRKPHFVPPVGLEPTNSEEEGFTVPCNCHYATSALNGRRYRIRTYDPLDVNQML